MQRLPQHTSIHPQRPDSSPTIPSVTVALPDPPSLCPSLIAVGASVTVANEMDRVYNTRALELRSYYETSINKAFAALTDSRLPPNSEKRILDNFANLYLTKVRSWIEDAVLSYNTFRSQVAGSDKSRRAFNTDYVPLLEHFFDENPLPTHADKVFLAKKSGMTYRQIHVWFQNRRNRTKKANRTWKKKPVSEGATLPLDSLRQRMGKYIVRAEQNPPEPENSRSSRRSFMQERTTKCVNPQVDIGNVLDNLVTPPYAFPSRYPPTSAYQPFSPKPLCEVSSTPWPRHPNNSRPSTTKLSIDDLVDLFALLSVRDTCPRRSPRTSGIPHDAPAATYSFTVKLLPAPLPALVKPALPPSRRSAIPPFPIVRASQPTSDTFATSIIASSSISLRAQPDNTSGSHRKVAPLPKRFPRHSPLSYRRMTPPTSEGSHSPSPSSSLRSLSDSPERGGEDLYSVSSPGLFSGFTQD